MNRDQFRGATRHLKGRAETALGGITGDPVRQLRGAVHQVTGGAQYAYGRARERVEDAPRDSRNLAGEVRDRTGSLIEETRIRAEDVGRRGSAYGTRATRYVDDNRASALFGLAAVAFAIGWLVRPRR